MYMNAITVNYAEVGDDYLPISFGFGSETSFAGKTVYNSTITKISGTSCIILQGQKLEPQNIIMSSSPAANGRLSDFTSGSTSWIEHIIPNTGKNTTTYIFYKSSDGYYYKMVENDQGKPVQEKYAPYARISSAADNKNKYPYCEAKIETPVPLKISNGKVNAIINGKSVQIAEMKSSLVVELENADGTPIRQTITENEYSIDTSIYDLNSLSWTRDGQKVMSWLSDNKIVKSSMSTNGWTKTIKLLAGNNIVTIPRNKSTITVNFTFTNTYMSSFEWGGAYHNGFNDSTMSGNTLTIKNARQGSSINLVTFYTDSKTEWFTPLSISPLPGQGTFNVDVSIPTPSTTDTIKFTGWINNRLVQNSSILCNHSILPDTYTINNMNTESLSNADIKIDNKTTSLLSYINNSAQFKRHKQITYIQQSSTGSILSSTTTIDDQKDPSTSSNSSGGKDIYIYTKDNNKNKIFNVTAHYTSIPAVVPVTNPSDTAAADNDQVVLFKDAYYVANDAIKTLVETLVSGVTVTVKKEVIKSEAKVWQTTVEQTYYEVTTTPTEPVEPAKLTYNYTPKPKATITISGNGDQISSVSSSDPNLTVRYTSLIDGTTLKITITYTVSNGFSLSTNETITTLNNTVSVLESTRNQKVTYKFFNQDV